MSVLRTKGLSVVSTRGSDFEKEVFKHSAAEMPNPVHKPFDESLYEVLTNQPSDWDPFRPPTPLAFSLRWHVAKHFNKWQRQQFGLYVATGTSLDWSYHADGLFYLGQPARDRDWRARWRRVTIDLSLDKPGSRADLRLEKIDFVRGQLLLVGGAVFAYIAGIIGLDELRTIT